MKTKFTCSNFVLRVDYPEMVVWQGIKFQILCESEKEFEKTFIRIIKPFELDLDVCLINSSHFGYLEIVKYLLPLLPDRSKNVAMRSAVSENQYAVVEYLLDIGTEVSEFVMGRAEQLGDEKLLKLLKAA